VGKRAGAIDVEVLAALLALGSGATGRRVAQAAEVSPTTASAALSRLEARGTVTRTSVGRAFHWNVVDHTPAVVAARRRQRGLDIQQAAASALAAPDTDRWPVPTPAVHRVVARALVLTALAVEYQAVAQHLRPTSMVKARTGTRFAIGEITGEGVDWEVRLAEIGAGNAGAAAEVAAAVEQFQPQLVLFVGVAGGLKPEDQELGDVVVADHVYNLHAGKHGVADDGSSVVFGRPVTLVTSHRLEQLAREVARRAWQPLRRGRRGRPQAHLKPIVASEAVLADDGSALRRRITSAFNDAAAIDMESYGTYEAARRADVPALAVRGLSDFADAGKQPAVDRKRQPEAAANAAAFAVALLQRADPDDFPGCGRPDTRDAGPGPGVATEARDEELLATLPPPVLPWWRRLRTTAPERAASALSDLAAHAVSPTGWLGRLQHRPPRWLRDDVTGDGWAMVAAFADSHQSPHATRAYDIAASAAATAGDAAAAVVLRLISAMSAVRIPTPVSNRAEDAAGPGVDEARRRLLAEDATHARPLAAFLSAAVDNDAHATLAATPTALHVLGLNTAAVLPGSEHEVNAAAAEPSAAAFADLEERSPGVLDSLRAQVLSVLTLLRLVEDDTSSAIQITDYGRTVVPASTGVLLLGARSRLQQVAGVGAARGDQFDEGLPALLAAIEQTALLVRDRRAEWHGPTGEALAIAGRARTQAHDFDGALRLLLPVPRGQASDTEARDPDVREVAALAATMAGNAALATELSVAVRDPVERHLLRGLALSDEPSMRDEAERSFRAALEATIDERPDQLVRALIGLVRSGASVQPDAPGGLAPHVARLRELDREAADLVMATAALTSGRPRDALVVARRYPRSGPAVQLAAEAAIAAGDTAEAVRVLERRGRDGNDTSMLLQAMTAAADAGLDDDAERLADLLATVGGARARSRALRTKVELAGRAGRWHDVATLCRRLLEEPDEDEGRVPARAAAYRWALVGAEFNLRAPVRALTALQQPVPLRPRHRQEALLLLAVLRAAHAEMDPLEAIRRALGVAGDWLEDEEVVASALTLTLLTSPRAQIPDTMLLELRRLQDDYFTRFADTASIQRVDVGEDLEGLISYLEQTFAPGAEDLTAMVRRVWLGDYPRALLTDAMRRSYAELLIKGGTGCVVVAGDGHEARRQAAARDAFDAGVVVIDTSVIHLVGFLRLLPTRLTAEFSRVVLPASLRDDLLAARASLSVASVGSLGWDPVQRRPLITEFSPQQTAGWSAEAEAMMRRAADLQVVPDPVTGRRTLFDASIRLASAMQAAVWADDLALTYAAESAGAPAFGTLDLLHVLANTGAVTKTELDDALAALMEASAVDLPVLDRLLALARDQDWVPTGYPALLLARPRSWADAEAGFARYRDLIRSLPEPRLADLVPGWAEAAAAGVAWAHPPGSRVRAIGALLAWTVIAADPGLLPALADVARRVQDEAAPDGNVFGQLVDVLADLVMESAEPAQAGAVFSQLVAPLDPQRRTEAMRRFLTQRPPTPRPE